MEVSPVALPRRDPRAVDAYAPSEIARRVRSAGVEDANRGIVATLWLSVIGGSMLGLAAAASTAAMAGSDAGFGPTRVIGGIVFALGLALVMTGGGELFTSNNLIAMAWASGRVRTWPVVVNWVVVYAGNIVGAASIAALLVIGGAYGAGDGLFAAQALETAVAKSSRTFVQDVALGVVGNTLVCLAVWACFSARTTTDRMLACLLPMIALVVLNADHVVANIHYFAAGMALRFDPDAVAAAGLDAAALAEVAPAGVVANLAGVTLGNIIGGSVLVAAVYWFVYLRGADDEREDVADAT